MDTLFWTALSPKIKILATPKLYFGKYLYRLEIECTGVTYLRGDYDSIEEFCEYRQHQRSINWGGSWMMSRNKVPSQDNINQLLTLEQLLDDLGDKVKTRVEEPSVQFYSSDADIIKQIAQAITNPDIIKAVTFPRNQADHDLLLKGYSIKATEPKWRYKFNIREARYSWEIRQQLHNYLSNLGDQVHIPLSLDKSLNDSKGHYIWGGYIYAQDEGVATMLKMIDPSFIRSIEEHCVSTGAK